MIIFLVASTLVASATDPAALSLEGPGAPPPVVASYIEAVPTAPEGCHVRASDGQVLIDCQGHALLVAAGDGARSGLLRLMDEQTAPFAAAGLEVSGRTEVDCALQGVAGRCLSQKVGIPGGAEMSLLGGLGGEGRFTALCLQRGQGVGDPCTTVVTAL